MNVLLIIASSLGPGLVYAFAYAIGKNETEILAFGLLASIMLFLVWLVAIVERTWA